MRSEISAGLLAAAGGIRKLTEDVFRHATLGSPRKGDGRGLEKRHWRRGAEGGRGRTIDFFFSFIRYSDIGNSPPAAAAVYSSLSAIASRYRLPLSLSLSAPLSRQYPLVYTVHSSAREYASVLL